MKSQCPSSHNTIQDPLLTIDDICIILRSMCQARVQESQGFPVEKCLDDFQLPLNTFLPSKIPSAQSIADDLCTMFSCAHLNTSLLPEQSLYHWAEQVFAHWSRNPAHIIFATSGSTGTPLYQCHHLCFLKQEAKVLSEHLVVNRRRIVASAPCHHIYGFLFTILLPKFSKLPAIYPPLFPTAHYTELLEEGDLIVSFPFFWQALIALGVTIDKDVHGISSTSPCPPATLHGIMGLGIQSIFNIYGSSETGGVGYQQGADTPFQLFSFWQKRGNHIQRKLPINSPLEPFTTPPGTLSLPFWEEIQLPDKTQWIDENHFIIDGRHDTIVQVGGKNVSLTHTQNCLLSHPHVQECAVRLMQPHEGKRLKCFCVLNSVNVNKDKIRTELLALCKERLSTAERPKKIHFGTELPTNALGKLQDWSI